MELFSALVPGKEARKGVDQQKEEVCFIVAVLELDMDLTVSQLWEYSVTDVEDDRWGNAEKTAAV